MIDTVHFRYSVKDEDQVRLLKEWLKDQYTESFKEIKNSDGTYLYVCKIFNLKVSLSVEYLSVKGSLNKLWLGNNINSLKLADISKVIRYLNSLLGDIVDIKHAKVRRLDFGVNIVMDYNPKSYVCKLHSSSTKAPTFYNGETISTGNKSRGMVVYDKTAEVKQDKTINIFVPDNFLRLEVRHTGRHVFKTHFGDNLPTVTDIISQTYKLPDIWYSEYKRLDKEYINRMNSISNQNELFIYTIAKTGFANCVNIINYSYELGLLNKQNKDRYYKIVKKAVEYKRDDRIDDLMKELDDKVLKAYDSLKTV